MFERLKRIWRAIFGSLIEMGEDPKMILQQNIRDMNDKIPEMNTGIAKARGGIIMLETEIADYKAEIITLTSRIKACLLAGEDGMAGQYAVTLKSKQEAQARSQAQWTSAKAGYDGLLKLKEKFLSEVKRKTEAAQEAIKGAESAKWKNDLADVFAKFEVAGIDATHDEMITKLKEKSAMADGKIAAAVEGMDMKSVELDQRAQELEGQELLKQFKMDMGLSLNKSTASPESSALDDFKKENTPLPTQEKVRM